MAKQTTLDKESSRRELAALDHQDQHLIGGYFKKGCDDCSDRFVELVCGGLGSNVVLDRQTITRIRWNLEAAGLLNVKRSY